MGSTFKPFVYAAAIDQLRMSPCDSLPDTRYCIEAGKHGNLKPGPQKLGRHVYRQDVYA